MQVRESERIGSLIVKNSIFGIIVVLSHSQMRAPLESIAARIPLPGVVDLGVGARRGRGVGGLAETCSLLGPSLGLDLLRSFSCSSILPSSYRQWCFEGGRRWYGPSSLQSRSMDLEPRLLLPLCLCLGVSGSRGLLRVLCGWGCRGETWDGARGGGGGEGR